LPWVKEWNPPGRPNPSKRKAIIRRAIQGFGIKLSDPEQSIAALSGGNQQKVLVSRWMEHRPRVLILDEPTRGVDVGAREEMFRILSELVRSGMAILLISSDLNEVLNMSHWAAVYRDGRILKTVPAQETDPEEVMAILTGVHSV
jgi:ABC-type sugar transport system ATPase subunit